MGPHHVSLLTWERVCGLCEVRGASTSRSNLVLSGCPLCDPETTDQRLTNDNPVLLLMWRPPDSPFVHVEYLHQFTLKTVLTLNIFCFFNTILGGRNMLSRLPNDAMSEFQSPGVAFIAPCPPKSSGTGPLQPRPSSSLDSMALENMCRCERSQKKKG